MSGRPAAAPTRARGAALHLGLLVAAAAAGGCGGGGLAWSADGSGPAGELSVWTATARVMIDRYDPSDRIGRPAAFCLVVGRREAAARGTQHRGAEFDPPATLLRRLSDLGVPVVPISACSWDGGLQEIHRPSGDPAVVVGISQPVWVSAEEARVQVVTQEHPGYRRSWGCRLRRNLETWEVRDCV